MVRRSAGSMYLPFPQVFLLRAQNSQRLRKVCSEDGAGLIEMALSIAVLLSLVLGIMELSMALYTFHFISEAARDGSRYAIVRGSSCPAILPGCPAAGAKVDVQTYLRNQGFPAIDPSLLKVTTTFPTTGSSCTPSTNPCDNPGNLVNVVVTYKYPLSIPFVPVQMLNMTSTSQMVISQ
jgi:Flp pilus assembly protein TadG